MAEYMVSSLDEISFKIILDNKVKRYEFKI